MIWAKHMSYVTLILCCRHWRRWSREVPACCWDSWPTRENYWERCSNPLTTRLSQKFSLQSCLGLRIGHVNNFCLISEELGVMIPSGRHHQALIPLNILLLDSIAACVRLKEGLRDWSLAEEFAKFANQLEAGQSNFYRNFLFPISSLFCPKIPVLPGRIHSDLISQFLSKINEAKTIRLSNLSSSFFVGIRFSEML